MSLIEKTSESLMKYIRNSLPDKTEEELEKIKYGIDIFLMNFYKIPVLWIIAYILGIFTSMVVATISFGFIRMFASGIHARKGWTCLLMTGFVLFAIVYLSAFLPLDFIYKTIFFIFSLVLIFLYAPADTEEKPLINPKLRQRLKIKAIVISVLYYLLSITFFSKDIIGSILIYSMFTESLLITPVIYKLFKRRYRNYEHFSQENF